MNTENTTHEHWEYKEDLRGCPLCIHVLALERVCNTVQDQLAYLITF